MIITPVILGAGNSRTGSSRRAQSQNRKQGCDGPEQGEMEVKFREMSPDGRASNCAVTQEPRSRDREGF